MPKIEISINRCKSCELCVVSCPKECIEIGKKINDNGYYAAFFSRPDDCTGCAICGNTCPDVAIDVWR